MYIDMTLAHLPVHILEEIFAFVPKNADLRLVCKTFKNIIDKSEQLMRNKWLIVDSFANDYINTINYHYQNFIIRDLSLEVFCCLSNYNDKDLVKAIEIRCAEVRDKESPLAIQYILFNYNSLETIRFDPHDVDIGKPSEWRVKFTPNQLSNLKTLDVSSYENHHDNILEMFSEMSSIKNLIISRYDYLEFPITTKWQLEELVINELTEGEVNDDNCKLFLQKQQSTLKKLIFEYAHGYAYFIMRYLPNLEHLKVNLEFDEEFNDSLLLQNSKLRRLDIWHKSKVNNNVMKAVLNHYDEIKYLSISLNGSSETGNSISFTLKFEHLTHLALDGLQSFPFLNSNSINIKVLVMAYYKDRNYDFTQMSNENLKNVEKLSLYFRKIKNVIAVVQKCPKLVELNLKINECYTHQELFISSINQILEITVNVKRLGLIEYSLKNQKLTREELLNQISNKTISINLHKDFKSMFADDWGRDNASYIDL